MTNLARSGSVVLALTLALTLGLTMAFTACARTPSVATPTAPAFITAQVLIEPDPGSPRWFHNLRVPKGTDGYELLVEATGGSVEADWFPQFRSHFVKRVLGVAPRSDQFWSVFVWDEPTGAWQPLAVGADLFAVKDGHVMAWALVPVNASGPGALPTAKP